MLVYFEFVTKGLLSKENISKSQPHLTNEMKYQ